MPQPGCGETCPIFDVLELCTELWSEVERGERMLLGLRSMEREGNTTSLGCLA